MLLSKPRTTESIRMIRTSQSEKCCILVCKKKLILKHEKFTYSSRDGLSCLRKVAFKGGGKGMQFNHRKAWSLSSSGLVCPVCTVGSSPPTDHRGSRDRKRAKWIREQTGVDGMPVAIKRKRKGGHGQVT